MEILELARQLGEAIKLDERVIRLNKATYEYENDIELLQKVGKYNEMSKSLAEAFETDGKDSDKVKELGFSLKELYTEIMAMPTMIEFTQAKEDVDKFMETVNGEIMYTVNGTRPCNHDGCNGDCAHCH